MSDIRTILRELDTLNKDDLDRVSEKIMSLLSDSVANETVKIGSCKSCNSNMIVKFGKDKNGKQRYQCKSCGSTFTSTSYTTVSSSRFSMRSWKKYIELMLAGASLCTCAKEVGISIRTSFVWRHKILHALGKDQQSRSLAGIIEVDEIYFPVSYKGNHKNSKRFTMPRDSRKRGSDCHDKIGSRTCVMCAIERNGNSYAEALGIGIPNTAMLTHAFDKRIKPDSILLSDKAGTTKSFFKYSEDIELIQLLAHVNSKAMKGPPEIRGPFHIQNINNLHTRLRRMLRPYNGVSTKYLNHYLNLFIWIENHKKDIIQDYKSTIVDYLLSHRNLITYNDLISINPIPVVA